MKKIIIILAVLFTVTPLSLASVSAQTNTVDDSKIEESLREKNLDKAPGVVEVEDSKMMGQEPSSGFVDENGKPLSVDEYNKIREENSKNLIEKYPVVVAIVIAGIIGVIVAVVLNSKKKR